MKNPKPLNARLYRQIHSGPVGGVSPAAGVKVFFLCILGIMEEQVNPAANRLVLFTGQPAFMPETQFIVGKKDKCFSVLGKLETEPPVRMVKGKSPALHTAQGAIIALESGLPAVEIKPGFQPAECDREIGGLHLMVQVPADHLLGMGTAA